MVEYKQIPGCTRYEVGTDGSIRSKCTRRKGVLSNSECKYLKQSKNNHGYFFVSLCRDDGRVVSRAVHRIVLETFVGPPKEGQQCRHYPDNNPANNHISNLCWGTAKEQQSDVKESGNTMYGPKNNLTKLTESQVREVFRHKSEGKTSIEIGRIIGVSKTHVYNILAGKYWSHLNLCGKEAKS